MEPTEESNFAESMQRLREARGWSQGELARRMVAEGWENYSQMTVSRTEKLDRPIRLGEASAIARLFGVNLALMTAGLDEAADILQALREVRAQLMAAQRSFDIASKQAEGVLARSRRAATEGRILADSTYAEWIAELERDIVRLWDGGVAARESDGEHQAEG